MKPSDVVALVAYVHELVPAQRVSEYTPDAWHDVLGDVPASLTEARQAAARVARRSTWIAPGEVRGELTRLIRPGRSNHLALPSRFESDEDRAARISRGAAMARRALEQAKTKSSDEGESE